jgi:hypothetical protein
MSIELTTYDRALLAEIQQLRPQGGRPVFDDATVAAMALTRGLHEELDALRFLATLNKEAA